MEISSQELQNRGIFPDIDSIIRNKNIPTIQLWIAFMLKKFHSRNVISLSQVVKAKCTIVKAEEISDISNATIVNYETAKFLENKPKKTIEECYL
ncbi:hypothetical protein F8M41_001095 [Gigaspora margarita]|uniref:Uncharacterized protein n=1 Tax=Gigaspora margarita TaxID=4874 RepID=A0A8H3XEX7_GIGMA|nr:hypothetical protein F8M41_001095 [Gigaspora margarita]